MRRILTVCSLVLLVAAFLPAILPGGLVGGAAANVDCDTGAPGDDDSLKIEAAITAAVAGDTINITHAAGGFCNIATTIDVTKNVTLNGQGATVTYLKGPAVAAVSAALKEASVKPNVERLTTSSVEQRIQAQKPTGQGGDGSGTGPRGQGAAATGNARTPASGGSGAGSSAVAAPASQNRSGTGVGTGSGTGQGRRQPGVSNIAPLTHQSTGPIINITAGPTTVQNLFITGANNSVAAFGGGGGISVASGVRVDILNNTVTLNSAVNGGGIGLAGNNDLSIIRGNTITQNLASGANCCGTPGGEGGGIWVDQNTDNLRVENNIISRNASANAGGGGMMLGKNNLNAVFLGNTFSDNYAAMHGGGLRVGQGNNNATIGVNNTFTNNVAGASRLDSHGGVSAQNDGDGGSGGGLSISGAVKANLDVTVQGNTFRHNLAEKNGGAVHIGRGNLRIRVITANTIDENQAGVAGGGIYMGRDNVDAVVASNTITKNSAQFISGGIQVGSGNTGLLIDTNTINDNLSGFVGGGVTLLGSGGIGPGGAASVRSGTRIGARGFLGGGDGNRNARVVNNQIRSNATAGLGGGIFTGTGHPNLLINNNTISANHAFLGGGLQMVSGTLDCSGANGQGTAGGRVGARGDSGCSSPDARVTNNTITENAGFVGAGGIGASGGHDRLLIDTNTIARNSAGSSFFLFILGAEPSGREQPDSRQSIVEHGGRLLRAV